MYTHQLPRSIIDTIQEISSEQTKRGRFRRFLYAGPDKVLIRMLREELNIAVAIFGVGMILLLFQPVLIHPFSITPGGRSHNEQRGYQRVNSMRSSVNERGSQRFSRWNCRWPLK